MNQSKNIAQPASPQEFQQALFSLVNSLLSVEGLRFNMYLPELNLSQNIGSDSNVDHMISEYDSKHWESDPLHPSKFEDSDVLSPAGKNYRSTDITKKGRTIGFHFR